MPVLTTLLIGATFIGTSPILVNLSELPPVSSAFWRVALALPALYLWSVWEGRMPQRGERPQRGRSKEKPKSWRAEIRFVQPGLWFGADLLFWHLALFYTTVITATLFANLAPLVVVAATFLFLREPLQRQTLAGVVVAVGGLSVFLGQQEEGVFFVGFGELFGLLTAVVYAGYMLSMRVLRETVPAGTLMFRSTVVSCGVLLLLVLGSGLPILPKSFEEWSVLVTLALLAHVGGQGLVAVALGHLPTAFVSLAVLVQVVVAGFLGWILLDQPVGLWQVAGGGLILCGIFLARPKA